MFTFDRPCRKVRTPFLYLLNAFLIVFIFSKVATYTPYMIAKFSEYLRYRKISAILSSIE